ncbi:MAG: hydrogenase maturation protease [Comamonadaceae bacterium]|nr:hydrogenase maturation protease [Comamonadaceae bacterium]
MTDDRRRSSCLGIGNVLWADEGFGVRCVEALHARYDLRAARAAGRRRHAGAVPAPRTCRPRRRLLIFDAIDYGLAPGTLKLVEDDEVPRFMGAKKMSLHQTGFQEVLALAQLTEQLPRRGAADRLPARGARGLRRQPAPAA